MKLLEEIENVCLMDGCIDEGILYAGGFECNILIEYQIENQKLKRLANLDGFALPQSSQIARTYLYGRSLFCFSVNSYEVAEYGLDTRTVHYYHPENMSWKYNMIHAVCRVKDKIWLFQDTLNPLIMVFSMKERKYFSYHISIDGQTDRDTLIQVTLETCVCVGDKIWRCIPGTSDLLVLDSETREVRIIKTGLQLSFYSLSYENGFLYLLSLGGGSVTAFHVDTHQVMVYQTGYAQTDMLFPFRVALKTEKYLLLLPCYEKEIFCYEMNGDRLRFVNRLRFPKEFKKIHDVEQRTMFSEWKKWNNGLYLFPFAGNGMLQLDLNNYTIAYYPVRLSSMDYLDMRMHNQAYLGEADVGLQDYLEYVNFETEKEIKDEKGGKIGKDIWEGLFK